MEQIQVINNNGSYDCDINISTEEWLELLKDPKITPPDIWKLLLNIYNRVYHPDKYSEIYGSRSNDYMNLIQEFGEGIQKRLGRFQIMGKDNNPFFWVIPMIGSEKPDTWTLRSQLVQAINKVLHIQEKLFQEAIKQYKQKLRDDPSYWEGNASKPNQRVAIAHFQDKWRNVDTPEEFASMFRNATAKTGNLLDATSQPRNMILVSAKYEPEIIREMFQKLFDNNGSFKLEDKDSVSRVRKSIEDFIQEAKKLTPEIKSKDKPDQKNYNLYQDINAVSTYLWLRYPDRYYKYKPKVYNTIKQIFGFYQYNIIQNGSVDSMLEGFAMYDVIRAKLRKDDDLVSLINSLIEKSNFKYKDTKFRAATVDFCYFVSNFFQPNIQLIQESATMFENPYQYIVNLLRFKKNVILQGAPGTGKTYSTAAIALGILGVDVDFSNHPAVMEKYEKYKDKKRIFFTTFHQSMDYEDFVEGLKPEVVKDNEDNAIGIAYDFKDGIFKDVCKSAIIANNPDNDAVLSGLNNNSTIWKINLDRLCGDSIRTDCLNNNYICLPKAGICEDTSKYKSFLRYIQDDMEVGDIVFLSHSSHVIDAIGIVTGKYEYRENNKEFPYSRDVRWIVKDIRENIVSINQGKKIAHEWFHTFPSISITDVLEIINKYTPQNNKHIDENPVILIIDEINRSNVSKIFGELVTLLEADKRSGNGDHPITVKLPYSKKEFSVPSNVYIIGTMNTTDRSTGTLDYAIRRRFAFVTLKANPGVIQLDIAQKLFSNIEAFIKKYRPKDMEIDDLMVGHSYFMTEKEDELKLKIQYEVIPLLKEYCNDGLLTCSQEILSEHIKKWVNLELFDDSNVVTKDETDDEEDEDQEE